MVSSYPLSDFWLLPFSTSYFLLSSMSSVVFLRAVNVGTNLCRPAEIARQLAKFGVVNIGAAGTFVIHEDVSESTLRAAIARKLPFKCEIMICPARDVIKLTSKDPYSGQPAGPDITRFVSVLHKRPRPLPPLPLSLPSDDDWLLKVIAIQDRFVLGIYRRQAPGRAGHGSQLEHDRKNREHLKKVTSDM